MSDTITVISTWINHPDVLKIHRDLWVQAFPGETVRYVAYIDAKDEEDFTNFNDFMKHTEKIIKDIMSSIIPDNLFTIETLNRYFIDKINDKRCIKPIPILTHKYPILTL